MKTYLIGLGILLAGLTVMLTLSAPTPESVTGDYFYAIESAGTLCGYSVIDTSMVVVGGKKQMLLEQSGFSMGKVLGISFDTHVKMVYHIDPNTGQFTYHRFDIDQAQSNFSAETRIEQNKAHCWTSFGRKEQVVEIPTGTLLENTLFFPRVLRDLSDAENVSYEVFDAGEQELQEVTYTRFGEETIELSGKEFRTVMVDKRNLVTGVEIRMWLDSETGTCVKIVESDGRVIYLGDRSLASKLKRFEADDYILTKTNVSIADVLGVRYMKVRAKMRPTGLIVTAEGLNVPGQSFTGTVENNLIEGVFEIEHPRFDGTNAPPFPPDFGGHAELAEYIRPAEFIESDDAGIMAKAHTLTEGSKDSWEAACRLSEWVSTEIVYSIPGGGSAKGVFATKAGECGGHSVLLAALCRAAGIPARVVWGVTYVPNQGGRFGQHGWNEIYMGEAGWIPVDATGPEIDFVDSGHIRLGLFVSFATSANAKEFEILDYRVAGVTADEEEAAAVKYAAYVGEYRAPGMSEPCEVRVQDGSLVFEIPDKVALAFEDPDENGRWQCKLSEYVYLTFSRTGPGSVIEVHLHEVHELPKQEGEDPKANAVPQHLTPYLGQYLLAVASAEFTINYERGELWMHHPLQQKRSSLRRSGQDESWISDDDRYAINFERDEIGRVRSMTIDAISTFRR